MKKTLFVFTLLLLGLASCGKVTPGTDPDSGDNPDPKKKIYNFSYIVTGDDAGRAMNLLFCDIEVEYKNLQGDMIKEKVTSLPWETTIFNITPPFTAEMSCKITMKTQEEIDAITQEPPYPMASTLLSYAYTSTDGTEHKSGGSSDIFSVGSKEDAVIYINRIIQRLKPIKVEFK